MYSDSNGFPPFGARHSQLPSGSNFASDDEFERFGARHMELPSVSFAEVLSEQIAKAAHTAIVKQVLKTTLSTFPVDRSGQVAHSIDSAIDSVALVD